MAAPVGGACWPYRRERAITCNKQYLFSLQSVTGSSYRTLDANEALAPLVDHQPASACQKRKAAILLEFRASMVVAANPRWRRTELLIPFYCVSSHVPSCRAFHPPTCTAPHMTGGLPSPCRDALSGVIGVSPRSELMVCCYRTTAGSGSQSSPRARYAALPLTPSTTIASSTETGSLACHSGDAAAACALA